MFAVMLLAMNPHSNQAAHKNTFQTFIPQKIPESNVLNPKNPFDYPRHLKSGVRGVHRISSDGELGTVPQKKFSFMPDKLPGLSGNWPEVFFLIHF